MTVGARLAAFLAPLAALSAAIMVVDSSRATRQVLLQEAERRAVSIALTLGGEEKVRAGLRGGGEKVILPVLQSAVARHGVLHAAVLDPSGRIIAHTDVGKVGLRPEGEARESRRPSAARAVVNGQEALEVFLPVWEMSRDAREAFLLSEEPYERWGKRLGTVVLALPVGGALATADAIAGKFLVTVVAAQALLILGMFWGLRFFLRPLGQLAAAADRLGAGEVGGSVFVPSSDEVGRLAESFNRMSAELARTTVSRDFLEDILSSMLDALILSGPDGRVRLANPSAARLLGFGEEELVGKDLRGLFHRPLPEPPAALDAEAVGKDGRRIPVRLGVAAVRRRRGEPEGLLLSFTDLTERKRAEEALALKSRALAASNQELERFAFVASHDLQEPLRKVIAFADRLQAHLDERLDEEGRHFISRMQAAVVRMMELIQGLLTLSRVERRERVYEEVDLDKAARAVLSDLEVLIQSSRAEVVLERLPRVEADALQMRQLLQNLISNAVKFAKKGETPRVFVRGRVTEGGTAVVEVEDRGVGFDEKFLSKLFQPFSRLHSRADYEGSGIGLAICRRIAEGHGGSIEASGALGQGATFRVRLPVRRSLPPYPGRADAAVAPETQKGLG